MLRLVWLALVVISLGCGSKPARPPVIENTTPKPVGKSEVRGKISDLQTGEGLAGVTVIVGEDENAVAITDEHGAYRIAVPNGRYVLHVYYLDLTVERDLTVSGPTSGDQQLDQAWAGSTVPVRCRGASARTCVPPKERAR